MVASENYERLTTRCSLRSAPATEEPRLHVYRHHHPRCWDRSDHGHVLGRARCVVPSTALSRAKPVGCYSGKHFRPYARIQRPSGERKPLYLLAAAKPVLPFDRRTSTVFHSGWWHRNRGDRSREGNVKFDFYVGLPTALGSDIHRKGGEARAQCCPTHRWVLEAAIRC